MGFIRLARIDVLYLFQLMPGILTCIGETKRLVSVASKTTVILAEFAAPQTSVEHIRDFCNPNPVQNFHWVIRSDPNPVDVSKYLIQSGLYRKNPLVKHYTAVINTGLDIHVWSGWFFSKYSQTRIRFWIAESGWIAIRKPDRVQHCRKPHAAFLWIKRKYQWWVGNNCSCYFTSTSKDFVKPTAEGRQFINGNSHHPQTTFNSILFGEAIRLRRGNQRKDDYLSSLNRLKEKAIRSKFPLNMTNDMIALASNREDRLRPPKCDKKEDPQVWATSCSRRFMVCTYSLENSHLLGINNAK